MKRGKIYGSFFKGIIYDKEKTFYLPNNRKYQVVLEQSCYGEELALTLEEAFALRDWLLDNLPFHERHNPYRG